MRKAGYKTTEFWFTLVSFIFSGLYLTGLINDNDQKEELISTVSHAVESCILIGGQFAIFYRYITSRKQEKIEYEKTRQLEEQNKQIEENKKAIEDLKKKKGTTNNVTKQRSNKSRSRKPNSTNKNKPKPSKKNSSS